MQARSAESLHKQPISLAPASLYPPSCLFYRCRLIVGFDAGTRHSFEAHPAGPKSVRLHRDLLLRLRKSSHHHLRLNCSHFRFPLLKALRLTGSRRLCCHTDELPQQGTGLVQYSYCLTNLLCYVHYMHHHRFLHPLSGKSTSVHLSRSGCTEALLVSPSLRKQVSPSA